jgi:hypothetical protein
VQGGPNEVGCPPLRYWNWGGKPMQISWKPYFSNEKFSQMWTAFLSPHAYHPHGSREAAREGLPRPSLRHDAVTGEER